MTKFLSAFCLLSALCVYGFSQPLSESGMALRRAPLTGLDGVVITVEPSDRLSMTGLTTEAIRSDVDSMLREAKVPILTEYQQSAGALYVIVNVLSSKTGKALTFNVNVEVWQTVTLVRNPEQSLIATTWQSGGIGSADLINAKSVIRRSVEDHVGEFLSDYLTANRK